MSALQVLETLQLEVPEAAEEVAELASLHQKKLWHQLTVKIDGIIKSDGPLNRGDVPLRLYEGFISDFASRINLLKLAQFAVHATRSLPNAAAMIQFLQGVVVTLDEMKLSKSVEPMLFVRMHIAQHHVETGALSEAKPILDAGQEQLQGLSSVDPSVSAAVFYVSSLLSKAQADFAGFYKNSLMYLSYVASDTLPADFKLRLAVDVSLAALLGEHVYSFGQLLQHPIIKVLDDSAYAWLHEVLTAFNAGDLPAYDVLCAKYAAQLNAQPALVANERRLREKITLMCLLELVSSLPAEERTIPLATIAQRTKLEVDGVEFLLMKALSLHLLEGTVDQVASIASITWVVPRILTRVQLSGLQERLDSWVSKVASLAGSLDDHTLGVAA
mmetsp:Transcript_17557/g.30125  ORF Transcript_17557/g.30125 Transcript_17557/m.30125 type:complete len:387 (-) Transcript_17557:300-1460(-)